MRPANPHGLTLPSIPDQAAQRTAPANVDVFNQGAPATPDAAPADPATPGNEQSDASRAVEVPRLSRSEEHTSELQSLMRISYAVFCLKQKTQRQNPREPPCN